MHRRLRMFRLGAMAAFGFATTAFAQEATDTQAPPSQPAAEAPMPAAEPAGPALVPAPGAESSAPAGMESNPAAAEGEPAVVETAAKPKDTPMYGVAGRWRWITVPGWFLDLFTQKNVPLYTFSCFALEGFRRKVDKDDPNRTWELAVGLGYQNMSPPDGYWLGKNKDPSQDADMVQTRDLSLITMDAAFVSRQYFGPYFGIHYGAGLGLGIVRGKVLRTSAQYDRTTGQYTVRNEAGQTMCQPDGSCNEQLLSQSEGQPDTGPYGAHRFEETSVPGALPIINLLVGIDGRIPIPQYHQAVEIRLEGGFFDAFFIGLAVGYQM